MEFNENGSLKIPEVEEEKKQEYVKIGTPALFSQVEPKWITQAFRYFNSAELLYFYTNSKIGFAKKLEIKKIYFKVLGKNEVDYIADFVGITDDNPSKYRLKGSENEEGEYYYGFKNLKKIENSIEIENLIYYNTGNYLRNDVQGVHAIIDPHEK